jgi:hypothetical protein
MKVDRRHLSGLLAAAVEGVFALFSIMGSSQYARFVRNCDTLTKEGERMSSKQIVQQSDAASTAGSGAIVDIKACTRARSAPKGKVRS